MIRRVLFALALALIASGTLDVRVVSAQWALTGGYVVPTNSSVITVDVLPMTAEVKLDGVLLGTGHDLLAQPIFVRPGEHTLEFTAPGHLTTRMRVVGLPDWTSRVWMVLVPSR